MSHFVDSQTVEGLLQHKSWNISVNSTVTSASTLTLTASSEAVQIFTGSTASQVLKMPDATTFGQVGQLYQIHNNSTQNITVQDSAAGALFLLGPNHRAFMICTNVGSAAGVWSYFILDRNNTSGEQFQVTYPGTGLAVNYTGGVAHFSGTSTVVPAGTITLTGSITGGWIYVDIDGVVKSAASLPADTIPLYQFTTTVSAVSVLTDERDTIEQNLVWGVSGDINPIRYNSTVSAGTLEKYARADHSHAANFPLYKSGQVAAGTFTGSPKTATVTFATAFPSSPNVMITGSDGRSWIATSVSTTGFTINAQANQALTNPVYWIAHITGESQ